MPISQISNAGISSTAAISTSKLGTGAVLQVLQATKTDTASTTSTSFIDVTGLSISITPSSSSNKILVLVVLGSTPNATNANKFNIVRNGTNIAQPDSGSNKSTINHFPGANNNAEGTSACWLDSPATTSAVTYKVQWCVDTATGYLNRHLSGTDYNSVSSITVMEIAA